VARSIYIAARKAKFSAAEAKRVHHALDIARAVIHDTDQAVPFISFNRCENSGTMRFSLSATCASSHSESKVGQLSRRLL